MSGRLVNEVLMYAPEDLTDKQMLVLVALAEDARESDRIARFITIDQIALKARTSPGNVRNLLSQLKARFLVVPTKGKGGNGRRQQYQLAVLHPEHRDATIKEKPSQTKSNSQQVASVHPLTQLQPEPTELRQQMR